MSSWQRHKQGGNRREVVLVALEDRFSLARIPSLLYHAGCRVTLLGDPHAPACASRFVQRMVPCPIDPPSAARALRNLLLQYSPVLPWVVFGDEPALQAGILCRQEKWLPQVFPVDPFKCADMIFRKAAFMEAAVAAGVPVPPMRVCRSAADARSAADQLQFPLFFKRDVDCAGAGVVLVSDNSDVLPVYQKLSNTGPVVIQQMVHGAVGKTNTLYSRGRLMCHTSAYATRTWPGRFGPSCIRQYFCDPRLEKIAADIGALTGFNGLCGFDWIQDRQTGQFTVIEFNGRTIATYHLAKYVHVDYERAIADFLQGRPTVQRPSLRPGDRPLIHMFPQDVRRCISEKDLLGLAKWFSGALTTDIPWGDANLVLFFLMDFVRLGRKRIRRLFRRFRPLPAKSPAPTTPTHALA
ncbi:MAG: hypothetical protein ABSH08_11150 [Tepidisphaeraceae bacterium]